MSLNNSQLLVFLFPKTKLHILLQKGIYFISTKIKQNCNKVYASKGDDSVIMSHQVISIQKGDNFCEIPSVP